MSRNSSFDSPRLLPGSSPLPAPQLSTGPALIPGGRAGRRGSASISSVNSSFSGVFGSGVAGSIGSAVDGSGQRQLLSDKYVLGEELGRGAFGQVYKGMDTRSGESVAIKQMCVSQVRSRAAVPCRFPKAFRHSALFGRPLMKGCVCHNFTTFQETCDELGCTWIRLASIYLQSSILQ